RALSPPVLGVSVMRDDRKKVWIDVFQTRLLWRTFWYWLIFTISMWHLLFAWWLVKEGPGNVLEQWFDFFLAFYPALIVFALVFPVLALDAVKFTHRLVGPLYRFRKTIQAVAKGEPVRLVRLREGDLLTDLRDDFNEMLETLQRRGVPVIAPADDSPT